MARSYSLGKHFERFIDAQIDSGRYNNASEVIRAGLRLLEDQEKPVALTLEELRELIQMGHDSGAGKRPDLPSAARTEPAVESTSDDD